MSEHDSKHDPLARGKRNWPVTIAIVLLLIVGIAVGALVVPKLLRVAQQQEKVAAEKKQLWTCGMHPQVIQDHPGNCPICGMALEPLKMDQSSTTAQTGERKIKYWWDPMMSPPYISSKPGRSPMGMDLVPVYEDEVSGGVVITIDPVIVQNMGVRVAQVTVGPIRRTIRTVGYLAQAQPRIYDVNLRVSGWVEKLYADTEGMRVEKGQPLFELYSPEVQVGIDELINARKAAEAATRENSDEMAKKTADVLVNAARRKLELWGLQPSQIDELANQAKSQRTVTFLSPVTGEVQEKMVVQGAMVKMGERALRLADRSVLWLDMQIYTQDLPFVRLGQKAIATIEAMPGEQFEGQVIFIDPQIDSMTRTTKVRVAMENPDLRLRPGMYATASIAAELAEKAILVPREAVLDTGKRQVVFVALERGHFEPRKIKTGNAGEDGSVEVLAGLQPGETIVTSGQFLMDSESRMKEAIQKHLSATLLSKQPATNGGEHQGHQPAETKPSSGVHNHGQVNAPAQQATGSEQWQTAVDATISEYLKLSESLGGVQKENKPLDAAELCRAATSLGQQAESDAQRKLAQDILKASESLVGQTLAKQREGFKAISEAMIALVDTYTTSRKVAPKLFVLYCSMANGRWLQSDGVAANPYYATDMKQCAEIQRTVETVQR